MDTFGRSETIVSHDDLGFDESRSGDIEDVTTRVVRDVGLSPGQRARSFHKASPKTKLDEQDRAIVADLGRAPLPLGYIFNPLLYSNPIDGLPGRTKSRLYRLVKGGHVRVVQTWRPSPQYWLMAK